MPAPTRTPRPVLRSARVAAVLGLARHLTGADRDAADLIRQQ
jgi:hypothetical protein